jgi:hypothetical protein
MGGIPMGEMNAPAQKPRPVVRSIPQEEVDRIFVPKVEQIEAIEREIALRHKVYPTRVSNGRMTLRAAVFQIAAMKAVLKTVEAAYEQEQKERNWV